MLKHDSQALRRNTIILSAFPSSAGESTSYKNILYGTMQHFATGNTVDEGLRELESLGYVSRDEKGGYKRLRDACSLHRPRRTAVRS